MSDVLELHRRPGGAVELVLNRPERLNALDGDLLDALVAAVEDVAADRSVRAVLVRGAGRAFCAGGDLRAAAESSDELGMEDRTARLRRWARAAELLRAMPKPTVAAVRGPAVGAGLGLALACDLRIASESAFFAAGYVKVGLSGDFGTAWSLTTHLGGSRARAMLLLGETLHADDALRAGLLLRTVDDTELESQGRDIVDRLAAGPRESLAGIKANIARAEGEPAWAEETRRHESLRESADHAEGRRAFLERRAPQFVSDGDLR